MLYRLWCYTTVYNTVPYKINITDIYKVSNRVYQQHINRYTQTNKCQYTRLQTVTLQNQN